MMARWMVLVLALHLSFLVVISESFCPKGFALKKRKCIDMNECHSEPSPCEENSVCMNTNGSFFCRCDDGFRTSKGNVNYSADTGETCKDINECLENKYICGPNFKCQNTVPHYLFVCGKGFVLQDNNDTYNNECEEENVCGQNAACTNTIGSYYCICNVGFGLKSGKSNFTGKMEQCEDICLIDKTICGNGTCHRGDGFTNYGYNGSRCIELNCDAFRPLNNPKETLDSTSDPMMQLKKACLELKEHVSSSLDVYAMLKLLLSAIDELLSSGALNDNRKISTFLEMVEIALKLIGPFIKAPGTKLSSNYTELELRTHLPQGAVTLSSTETQMNIQLETAAGDPSYYPVVKGFTHVSLLSYKNLEDYAGGYITGMKHQRNERFKINSKVVTVTVSNRNTSFLNEPVKITFHHLEQANNTHKCAFWDSSEGGGSWSARGCSVVESNPNYTVCSCTHLSSFAVLMALYEIENKFELQMITWVGLSLSQICLFFCILTFSLIRSIKCPRNTIHLHLCISLFIANLIFLAGISHTENLVGCAVVAGLLHFFYLAAFCWMCLEGIQLFRMVVLVFNTNFKTLYMMAGGYGVPAVIVTISASANAKGYGTDRHCWLNLNSIWSFFGPVCVIIIINIFFFLITVWKLAQKFSSLNPDLDNLHKIKAFTITAVAQLCVLGIMWIFGCFQFEKGTITMSYMFTILGSFQGFMLFVMHCLFSKQVREEYQNILSRFCAPQKKRYSEFSTSRSSKAQGSKSVNDTGESRI